MTRSLVHQAVLTWLVMTLSVVAQRKPYDYTDANDVAELLKYYGETKCTSISLGNNTYQQLLFYGKPLRVYAFGAQVCPDYMVFDPNVCRCNVPGVLGGIPDSDDEGPCTTLADISYSEEAGVYRSATFVREYGSERTADLTALSAQDSQGPQGRRSPLRLNGAPLVVESFSDNELIDPWRASLRVMADSAADGRASRAVLVSDDCGQAGQARSLELALEGGRLDVFCRFNNHTVPDLRANCNVQPTQDGWLTLEMESEDSVLSVRVNDRPCVVTLHSYAILAMTKCPLYLGGNPRDTTTAFYGWLDYFKFKKGPKDECPL